MNALSPRREDLLAAILARYLVNAMREAEIAAFRILHDLHSIERVV